MKRISDRAYDLFLEHGSLTDVQLHKFLGVNPNSVRPVRLKLEEMGLIRRMKAKKKHTRGRSSNNRVGHHTIFKLIKNPKLVEISPLEKKYQRMLIKVKQLEIILLDLIKKV
jgi:transcription initiation factor IIE alpha subunit